jgi:hypothetical protein
MNKRFLASSLLFLFLAAISFAFDGYVDIVNQTGYTINYIYVSHESHDTWGDDMLGDSSVLPDGKTYRVYLTGQPSSIFDVMVEDEDGDTYTFLGIDVELEDVVVTLDDLDSDVIDSTGETTVNGPGGDFDGYVDVTNDTGFTMYYLYIKQNTKTWSPDLLGDNVLEDGDMFTVYLNNYPESIFDIRLEDGDGDTYTFPGVDVEIEDVYITLENLD